jgi:hypothetical protein
VTFGDALEYPILSWGSQIVWGKNFRFIINWCMMAMKKGSTQDELNKAFALKTEIFHPQVVWL